MNKEVFNQIELRTEPAEKRACPRCGGFGAVRGDDGCCRLCAGAGKLWMTVSGWCLRLYGRRDQSELY